MREDSNKSVISRRKFVEGAGSLAAASLLAPDALAAKSKRARSLSKPLFRDGSFPDGVISGEPTTDGITLWTRIEGVSGRGAVKLEVAKERDFRKVVARETILTSENSGHAVKARIKGLSPYERYYYRFEDKDGSSQVGRFQTALPADSEQPVRFAFFSCQDYVHGYYNAHDLMAKEDIDFVINLGDYIYADRQHPGLYPTAVRKDPIWEAKTLDQFRAKYRLYRKDASLRKMHSLFPMISIWDDHEIKNDYAGAVPGYQGVKRPMLNAGYRAFFENMPLYPIGKSRIYRSLKFGKNLELILLDERQYRSKQPCDNAILADPQVCSDIKNPRKFLGRDQMQFLKNRLTGSQATWKVIGNEVMIMPVKFENYSVGVDAWNGYPVEQSEVVNFIKANNVQNVAFVTGDIHTFAAGHVWAGDGTPVATEFVGGSISSVGLGEINLALPGGKIVKGNDQNPSTPAFVHDLLRESNPWVLDVDTDHHGYGVVTVSKDRLDVGYRYMQTIKKRTAATFATPSYTVYSGQPKVIKTA